MAISQPSLYPINAFDATKGYTVTFAVNADSDQVAQNRLVISTNPLSSSPTVVYDSTIRSFQLQHTIPAGRLTNGTNYTAVVYVYNTSGDMSSASSSVPFSCYSTPEITFNNIKDNDVIDSASFIFNFTYTQVQNRALHSYNMVLYDASLNKVQETGTQYTNSTEVPYSSAHQITGLIHNTAYSIQIEGYTVDGMSFTSPLVHFVVAYGQTNVHTRISLTNNCQEGYVVIQSGLIPIEGITRWDPTYINNAEIDLTDGNSVTWNRGYKITGDFTLRAWGRAFIPGEIIILYNELNQRIRLEYHDTYVSLHVDPGYVIASNELARKPTSAEQVFIWVRRINNLYDIKIENKGVVS